MCLSESLFLVGIYIHVSCHLGMSLVMLRHLKVMESFCHAGSLTSDGPKFDGDIKLDRQTGGYTHTETKYSNLMAYAHAYCGCLHKTLRNVLIISQGLNSQHIPFFGCL